MYKLFTDANTSRLKRTHAFCMGMSVTKCDDEYKYEYGRMLSVRPGQVFFIHRWPK